MGLFSGPAASPAPRPMTACLGAFRGRRRTQPRGKSCASRCAELDRQFLRSFGKTEGPDGPSFASQFLFGAVALNGIIHFRIQH
jgi:hypothetical protein